MEVRSPDSVRVGGMITPTPPVVPDPTTEEGEYVVRRTPVQK